MSQSAILAVLRSIDANLKFNSPYIENETLRKASAITSFGDTLEIAGQEFDQFVIQTDGNEDDISYRVKNLQGGFTEEIELRKFPYLLGPVDVIQFKNDTAEAGKSIFVRKIRPGRLVPTPIVWDKKIIPPYRSDGFETRVQAATNNVAEDTSATSRFSYTVPSGKRAQATLHLSMICLTAATTTTDTDVVGIVVSHDPDGGTEITWDRHYLASEAMAAGDRNAALLDFVQLDAGDVIKEYDIFDGDAAGAGVVKLNSGIVRSEWSV